MDIGVPSGRLIGGRCIVVMGRLMLYFCVRLENQAWNIRSSECAAVCKRVLLPDSLRKCIHNPILPSTFFNTLRQFLIQYFSRAPSTKSGCAFSLPAPYSEERRRAASEAAKKCGV